MSEFYITILIGLVKLGLLTTIFGFSLIGLYRKCKIPIQRAIIPYYNLIVWIRLTKNTPWLLLLLLQWYIIPNIFVYGFAFVVLLKLIIDSEGLLRLCSNKPLKIALPPLLLLITYATGIIPSSILFSIFLIGIYAYQFTISHNKLPWDKARYHANNFNFWKYAGKQFKKNKVAIFSAWILGIMIFIGIYGVYLANNQPIFAIYKGKTFFPAYATLVDKTHTDSVLTKNGVWEKLQFDITDWKRMNLDAVVWAPITYSPENIDEYNANFISPSGEQLFMNSDGDFVNAPSLFRHHLGTDNLGRDVASGLIHGTKVSLSVGIISMGIASLLGILLGALAGFYGDYSIKIPRIRFFFAIFGIIIGFFYGFITRNYLVSEAFENSIESGFVQIGLNFVIFIGVICLFTFFSKLMEFGWFGKRVAVPIDTIISRIIEILNSIPRLLLIITVAAIVEERSLVLLMVIIGLTSWTGIARFTRAELLRIRELEYIQASRALGFIEMHIIIKHAIPNALAPVFISIAFGIASAILIESGLSFLGIGVPDETVTWGSLLSEGRQQFEAWWLVIFPGLAIFLTVTVYNLIGEGLRDALDPRMKI